MYLVAITILKLIEVLSLLDNMRPKEMLKKFLRKLLSFTYTQELLTLTLMQL